MKQRCKTTILAVLLLTAIISCRKVMYEGNTGKIIYTHFKPALNINLDTDHPTSWKPVFLDLNKDKNNDLRIYFAYPYQSASAEALDDWELCRISYDDNTPIDQVDYFSWQKGLLLLPGYQYFVRQKVEEDYCYGWIHTYMMNGSEGDHESLHFYIEDVAYCTCPNYPIKWGEK